MSLFVLLLVLALALTIASAMNKVPLWTAVFVALVALLVKYWGA